MHPCELVGRSSSHFTRVAQIFAIELGVPYGFRPVFDIATLDAAAYADNPALKIPILVDERGPLFGTENICRELVSRSAVDRSKVVLRGDLSDRLVANAEELAVHVMSSEVTLILAKMAGDARLAPPKVAQSIEQCLEHLDRNIGALLDRLPADRRLSFVEVALFCVVRHLPFREVMDIGAWKQLGDFCEKFGQRKSALATEYRFDAK